MTMSSDYWTAFVKLAEIEASRLIISASAFDKGPRRKTCSCQYWLDENVWQGKGSGSTGAAKVFDNNSVQETTSGSQSFNDVQRHLIHTISTLEQGNQNTDHMHIGIPAYNTSVSQQFSAASANKGSPSAFKKFYRLEPEKKPVDAEYANFSVNSNSLVQEMGRHSVESIEDSVFVSSGESLDQKIKNSHTAPVFDNDADFARLLQMEEENRLEMLRKQVAEDERLAAKLARPDDMHDLHQLEEDERIAHQLAAEFDDSSALDTQLRSASFDELESFKALLEQDTKFGVDCDQRNGNWKESEVAYAFLPAEHDNQRSSDALIAFKLAMAEQEEEEEKQRARMLQEIHDEDLARILVEEEENARKDTKDGTQTAGSFSFINERIAKDAEIAAEIQRNLDMSSARHIEYIMSQPHGELVLRMQEILPEVQIQECYDALERADYSLERAIELVQNFPPLGSSVAGATVSLSNRQGDSASTNYPIHILTEKLRKSYGHIIPIAALKQAAEDAGGLEERAEILLVSRFPREVIAKGMHDRTISKLDRSSSSASQHTPAIRVTKYKGFKRDNISEKTAELEREIGELDSHYVDLAQRAYTIADLVEACVRFGGGKTGSFYGSVDNDLMYGDDKERFEKLRALLTQLIHEKELRNRQGQFPEAAAIQQKINSVRTYNCAVAHREADAGFIQHNLELANLILRQSEIEPSRFPLSVDLHTLHADQAKDRTMALLQIAQKRGWKTLKVITGKGIHSRVAGQSVIRNRILYLLNSRTDVVRSFEDHGGYFLVRVKI